MAQPVTVAEAKLFLRVEHEAEDGLIQTLVEAAQARVEGDVGLSLTSTSPAPLIFRDAASDALVREAFFDQAAKTWRLVVPDFGVLEGSFLVAALEYAGDHGGEATFAISLASAGAVAFSAI